MKIDLSRVYIYTLCLFFYRISGFSAKMSPDTSFWCWNEMMGQNYCVIYDLLSVQHCAVLNWLTIILCFTVAGTVRSVFIMTIHFICTVSAWVFFTSLPKVVPVLSVFLEIFLPCYYWDLSGGMIWWISNMNSCLKIIRLLPPYERLRKHMKYGVSSLSFLHPQEV